MSELTGEQLTEKFFTEVKGWVYEPARDESFASDFYWYKAGGDGRVVAVTLAPLHTSLDLQEEWLWPELFSKKVYLSDIDYYPDEKLYKCRIQGMVVDGRGTAPTKALAQLEAGLKALGVI